MKRRLWMGLAVWVLGFARPALGQPDTSPPVIAHTPLKQALKGRRLVIKAKISDAHSIFAPAVYVRRKGTSDYDNFPMRPKGAAFQVVLPASMITEDLEYFIEAFDDLGNGPSRVGAPSAPIRVQVVPQLSPPPPVVPPPVVPPPPSVVPPSSEVTAAPSEDDEGSIWGRWWLWTAVGVAVAGAAVGTVFLLQQSPDFVTVEVVGPDPTANLP